MRPAELEQALRERDLIESVASREFDEPMGLCPACPDQTRRQLVWISQLRCLGDCNAAEIEAALARLAPNAARGAGRSNGAGGARRPVSPQALVPPQKSPHEQRDVADVADVAANPRYTRELLDRAEATVRRYVVLPGDAEADALALWILHSWAFDAAHSTPYLLVLSPEKRSGKTRLLEVLEQLVRRPWRVAGASEAAMFRLIEQQQPTLMLDEIDALFSSSSERLEPLRGLLNAGNRPGTRYSRCVGESQQVRHFAVYCPKVLAGIDNKRLPDTIKDRAIEVRMKRKAQAEQVERFLPRKAEAATAPVREELERWAEITAETLADCEPDLPRELNDRAAEAWEPLFAIADVAGGDWPRRARSAALALSGEETTEEASHGARILEAAREAFGGRTTLSSAELRDSINGNEELPYGGWNDGRGITPRKLAAYLGPYGIKPRTVRLDDGSTPKGYHRQQFEDAWMRYLPSPAENPPHRHIADAERDLSATKSATSSATSSNSPPQEALL